MNKKKTYSYFVDSHFDKFSNDKLPNRIIIDSINYDIEGFRIVFKDENCNDAVRIKMSFEDFEHFSINPHVPDRSLDLFDSPNWPFYIGVNTAMVKRYHYETYGLYEDRPIKHYVVIGVDDETIEILSQSDPVFTLLPDNLDIS